MTASTFSLPHMQSPPATHHRQRRPFFKRFSTYLHLFIIAGLAVPVMIYLQVMQSLGWRMPSLGVNGVFSYIASSSSNVVLYASPNTKAFLSGIGGNYDVLLTPWRDYFADRKTSFKEIQDISTIKGLDSGVLILPSAVALSPEERTEILAFRSRGGSILSTWATGTRNTKGEWAGWNFAEELGAKVVGEIGATSDANHLILNGESPVTHTLPAGQRIFISKTSESLLRIKGEAVAGRFMNWARITEDERRGEGAIVYSETTPQAGRVVFFAFAESAWASHPALSYSLFDDVITWLQREPTVVRAAWPNGKHAANVIEMDTEQGFPNALNFATMMQAVEYPTSFYVLTSVGKQFPDVLNRLNRESEVDFHGDIHIGFKDQTVAAQSQRLQTMQKEMASVIPDIKNMTGFRAPTEGYDQNTEKLLQQMGIRHHVADPNRTEGRLPLFAKVDPEGPLNDLVVLPRTQRDDINLYWEKLSVEQTTKALIDDAELALDNAGLGLLSVHTQNFNADGVLYKAMPGYLVHLKQRKGSMWLASARQVADWWRDRERFKMSSNYTGKRLEFNITITGKTPVKGASLVVMLPQKDVTPVVQPTKINGIQPTVTKIDAYRAAIVFNTLTPGNHAFQVTFSR
jgi:hypothetical protein